MFNKLFGNRTFYIGGIFIILICSTVPVFATSRSIEDLRREQQNARNALSSAQSSLNSTRAEMHRVELQIMALDEELILATDELELIVQTLGETRARLAHTEQELEQAREDRDNQFEAFRERLRVMHEYGAVSFLDVLLSSASIRDFISRWEFVNTMARHDQEMLDRMQAAEDRIAYMVEDIVRQKNMII